MMRRLAIKFTSLLLAIASPPAVPSDNTNWEIRKAQEEMQRFPKAAQKRVNLALLYANHGERSKTVDLLKEAVTLPGGKKSEYYDLLVHYLFEERLFDEGRSVSEENIKANPHDPQALITRTEVSMHFKQYPQVLADCTEALKLLPSAEKHLRTLATGRRGRAYLFTGQWAKGVKDYDIAIALEPTKGYYYTNRANGLLKEGQIQAGLADLEKAINLAPDKNYAYLTRAEYYEQSHQYEKAIADLSMIISRNQKRMDKSLYERRIKLYELTGQKALAEKDRTTLKDFSSVIDEVFKPLK